MIVEAQVSITGSKAAVWDALTSIETVERPANALVGLKWRETRVLFGKPATTEKWITEVTTNRIAERDGGVTLTSSHETRPQGLVARIKAMPMFVFKGAIRKAILQDLNDRSSCA